MMHNKHDARQDYMKLLMARDDANKSNTSRQVKWSSIFNELHIDETPHRVI